MLARKRVLPAVVLLFLLAPARSFRSGVDALDEEVVRDGVLDLVSSSHNIPGFLAGIFTHLNLVCSCGTLRGLIHICVLGRRVR